MIDIAQRVGIARSGECIVEPRGLLSVVRHADRFAVTEPPFDVRNVLGGNRRRDGVYRFEPERRPITTCRCGRHDVERVVNVPLAQLLHNQTIETRTLDGNGRLDDRGLPQNGGGGNRTRVLTT